MRRTLKILAVVITMMHMFACVKPFNPPVLSSGNLNYLVVDGFIMPGTATTIKLSRTSNISDSFRFVPELNAQLLIEGLSGSSFSFQTGIDGVYTLASAFLSGDDKYRLHIYLSDGKEYVSDYVEVKQSPPIDSIEWQETDDISIYVDTHDPAGKARYYKWEFDETVEYRAIYDSYIDYKDHQLVFLLPDQYRYQCFKFYHSTNIAIANSASLTDDVIRRARVTVIPNDYSKIAYRYSILIKQYALTPEAYKYWQVLQANTEQNGNIFDPQPAQLKSNIHNVSDPNEPVIGFVSASIFSEKRIFIKGTQLQHRPAVPYADMCPVQYPDPSQWEELMGNGMNLPAFFTRGQILAVAPAICVDCRLQGGTTEKPSYW